MRIVLLTTARGVRPGSLVAARDQLGAIEDDLSVVSLHPPRSPLPVERHVMVGMAKVVELGVAKEAARAAPPPGVGTAAAPAAAPHSEDGPPPVPGSTPRSEPLAVVTPSTPGVGSDSSVERHRAQGVSPKRSLGSRVRSLPRGVMRRASRILRAVPAGDMILSHERTQKARAAGVQLSRATRFAIGVMRASAVQDLVANADLVVAVDAPGYRAAWLLARRHPRPRIVIGYAAGRRALDANRLEECGTD